MSTSDLHSILTRLGLRSEMPNGWDGEDPWARYAKAGIILLTHDGHVA